MQTHDPALLKPKIPVPPAAIDTCQRFALSGSSDGQMHGVVEPALVEADRGGRRCSSSTHSRADKLGRVLWASPEGAANSVMASSTDSGSPSISASRGLLGRDMVVRYPLAVGGLTRFSSVDYPGHIAAVVLCSGCPWHCASCHLAQRLSSDRDCAMSWHEIADWLDNRHGLLDAVVFSGGEPLHQRGLVGAMWQAHDMGYRVALHTAGIYPDRLAGVMPLVDWLSFDVKGPFADYPRITGAKRGGAAQRALSFVLDSGKPHEVRCTVDETVLTIDDASRMAREVAEMGVSRLVLQAQSDSYGNSVPVSPDFVNAMACWIECVERRLA